MQAALFLLSCPVSISSADAPYSGRHPPKLMLWGRGQTAGQSVIRTHLVFGGSARPQVLSLAWHSYLIPSLESPLKVGIIIPHLQKRKRSQARGPVQTTGFVNSRVGNWHQSSLLPNPAMIRSRGQDLPPSPGLVQGKPEQTCCRQAWPLSVAVWAAVPLFLKAVMLPAGSSHPSESPEANHPGRPDSSPEV